MVPVDKYHFKSLLPPVYILETFADNCHVGTVPNQFADLFLFQKLG